MHRRLFLAGVALTPATIALASFPFAGSALAASVDDLPIVALPAGADPATVPGLSWFGSGPSAIEIFDYNCPYCRKAFETLDARVAKKKLRLGLMDSPQLSSGSVQAAKIRQAALILYGPDKAYEFHRRLYARKGMIDGDAALAVAGDDGPRRRQAGGRGEQRRSPQPHHRAGAFPRRDRRRDDAVLHHRREAAVRLARRRRFRRRAEGQKLRIIRVFLDFRERASGGGADRVFQPGALVVEAIDLSRGLDEGMCRNPRRSPSGAKNPRRPTERR